MKTENNMDQMYARLDELQTAIDEEILKGNLLNLRNLQMQIDELENEIKTVRGWE